MENHSDKIEEIKRDIKRIRRSGTSAEILGLLLILFAAAYIWFSKTNSSVYTRFAIFGLLGVYFFFSGIYIKDGWGRRVKIGLLLNGILSFPLSVAILPIYVCVQSINNYTRHKELPEKVRGLYNRPKPFRILKRDKLLLVTALVIGVISLGVRLYHLSKAAPVVTNSSSVQQPVVETESSYSFKAKFPGPPSVMDFSEQVSGHTISYSTYSSFANHGSEDFDVYAYNWPAQYYDFGKLSESALDTNVSDSLTSIVQSLKGTLVSSSKTTYLGHAAEDAQFTCPTFGSSVTGYIRVFYIGNYEYGLVSLAASQSEFSNFANSFAYVGN